MALPSSGPLSINDMRNFFGVPNSDLNVFHRNYGIVPSYMTQIPDSGPISIAHFYGAENGYVPSGPLVWYENFPINTGGRGEGFYRVAGQWQAQKSGRVRVNYYGEVAGGVGGPGEEPFYDSEGTIIGYRPAKEGVKLWDIQLRLLRGGGVVGLIAQNARMSGGNSVGNVYLSGEWEVDVLPGDVIQGYIYIWGAYGSDHVEAGHLYVWG
jgi:hypothetical protein